MIFVTGATGFIGKKLVDSLQGDITILSRIHHPKYKTIVCDLRKEEIPHNALHGVSSIFHLASLTEDTLDTGLLEPNYRKVNIDATVRLAELASRASVEQFVFVSSAKAESLDDNVKDKNHSLYSYTKREAELRLLEIGCQSSMKVKILRPSLVYGPSMNGNLTLMRRGIEQGWFPPLPETGNRRSMIHVDDVVQALLLIAGDDRADGEVYVATDGRSYSSRQIYEILCQVVGRSVPRWGLPESIFQVIACLSPQMKYKINKLLGSEHYCGKKLEDLGFKASKSLLDIDR